MKLLGPPATLLERIPASSIAAIAAADAGPDLMGLAGLTSLRLSDASPGMIDAVEMSLAELGVPLSRIASERFVYDSGIATPRERLTRAVIAGVVAVQLAAVLAFMLR